MKEFLVNLSNNHYAVDIPNNDSAIINFNSIAIFLYANNYDNIAKISFNYVNNKSN